MKMQSLYVILVFICSVGLAKAQQQQDVQSIAFYKNSNAFIKVKVDGKEHLYSIKENLIIDNIQQQVGNFVVAVKDGNYGVLLLDGTLCIPFEYDKIKIEYKQKAVQQGIIQYEYLFAILQKDGQKGLMNEKGHIIIPPKFEQIKIISKNIIAVAENGTWGWISSANGKMLCKSTFQSVNNFTKHDFIKVSDGNKFGIANINGHMIVPMKYDNYMRTIEANGHIYLDVQNANLHFLFDTSGQLLLSAIENIITISSTGNLSFQKDKQWGIIHPFSQKIIVQPVFDQIEYFVKGFGIVKKSGKYGVINEKGETIADFVYDEINFINAAGETKSSTIPIIQAPPSPTILPLTSAQIQRIKDESTIEAHPYFIQLVKGNAIEIKDWNAKTIIPLGKYETIKAHYYNGNSYFIVSANRMLGITDEGGNEILPVRYKSCYPGNIFFKAIEGQPNLARRFILFTDSKEETGTKIQTGIFDLAAKKIIIEPDDQDLYMLNHRYIRIIQSLKDNKISAWVYNIENKQRISLPEDVTNVQLINERFFLLERQSESYELTDSVGNLIYKNPNWRHAQLLHPSLFPKYDNHNPDNFYHGIMKIYSDEGNLFIDEKGHEIRFPDYDPVDPFYEGFALAASKIANKNSLQMNQYKYGLIDINKNVVIPPDYDRIRATGPHNEIFIFGKGELEGAVSRRTGKFILQPKYWHIDYSNSVPEQLIIISKEKKYGLATIEGQLMIEPAYDELFRNINDPVEHTWPIIARQGEWWYIVKKDGKRAVLKARQRN